MKRDLDLIRNVLIEIEQEIEKYSEFGKSVHITESSFPATSSPEGRYWGGGEDGARYVWRGDVFTEDMQADWLEYFYTIAYSKPYIQAVTWWNLADPSFIYHGGLLREDFTPRPAYDRLLALRKEWGGSSMPCNPA